MMYDELELCYTHPKYGKVSIEKIKKILRGEDNVLKGNEAGCAALNIKIFANAYLRNDLDDVDYYNLLISIGSVIRSSDTNYSLLKTSIACLMLTNASESVVNVILNGGEICSLDVGKNRSYFPDPCSTLIFHPQKGIHTLLFKMLMMLGLNIASPKFLVVVIHRMYTTGYDSFTIQSNENAFVDMVLYTMRNGFAIKNIDRNNFEDGFTCKESEVTTQNRSCGIISSYSINNVTWNYDVKCTFCKDTDLNVIGSEYTSYKCYVNFKNASRLCSNCYFYEQLIKIENLYKKEVELVEILQLALGIKT